MFRKLSALIGAIVIGAFVAAAPAQAQTGSDNQGTSALDAIIAEFPEMQARVDLLHRYLGHDPLGLRDELPVALHASTPIAPDVI